MEAEALAVILGQWRKARASIDAALPDPGQTGKEPSPRKPDDLAALSSTLSALFRAIPEQLKSMSAYDVQCALFPLVIHCDEVVLERLTDFDCAAWPSLFLALCDGRNGGDVFYQVIDKDLKEVPLPRLRLALSAFCLRDGFTGRYAKNPASLDQAGEPNAHGEGDGQPEIRRYQARVKAALAEGSPKVAAERVATALGPVASPGLARVAESVAGAVEEEEQRALAVGAELEQKGEAAASEVIAAVTGRVPSRRTILAAYAATASLVGGLTWLSHHLLSR